MKKHRPFLPSYAFGLSLGYALFSLTLIVLFALEIIPSFFLLGGVMLGLTIVGRFVKRVTRFYNEASTVKEALAQYSVLLEAIESENFESSTLKALKNLVDTDGKKASAQLKELAKLIDYLGNRNNMIFGPLANGLFLWDFYFTSRIDRWFQTHNVAAEDWMRAIETFDALNSLGNFAYNQPGYCFPEIAGEGTVLKAEQLAHPLISPSKVVPSDVQITNDQFYIITGANMAGKSTFLRTISLSIVMANCGLPVSAHSFTYRPIPLISSMRTSDSLQDEASYFFAELKRLKFVVDTVQSRPYFIVLDEILKGTNSQDKAEGSKKFVERLLSTSSVGIIATHDLSLCDLEKHHPQIQNRYFDAEIINDELHFDYRLKMGVCQNMNASFLLKKMGIV
jgi:dsDNA-specific endonuclease/ATPase MutS2